MVGKQLGVQPQTTHVTSVSGFDAQCAEIVTVLHAPQHCVTVSATANGTNVTSHLSYVIHASRCTWKSLTMPFSLWRSCRSKKQHCDVSSKVSFKLMRCDIVSSNNRQIRLYIVAPTVYDFGYYEHAMNFLCLLLDASFSLY